MTALWPAQKHDSFMCVWCGVPGRPEAAAHAPWMIRLMSWRLHENLCSFALIFISICRFTIFFFFLHFFVYSHGGFSEIFYAAAGMI